MIVLVTACSSVEFGVAADSDTAELIESPDRDSGTDAGKPVVTLDSGVSSSPKDASCNCEGDHPDGSKAVERDAESQGCDDCDAGTDGGPGCYSEYSTQRAGRQYEGARGWCAGLADFLGEPLGVPWVVARIDSPEEQALFHEIAAEVPEDPWPWPAYWVQSEDDPYYGWAIDSDSLVIQTDPVGQHRTLCERTVCPESDAGVDSGRD